VNSPKGKQEDHIIKELIPAIDNNYRTIALRGSRAIAGLSMGGYGSLLLGLKYPQLFTLAGSFSGAVAVPQSDSANAKEVFGDLNSPLRKESDLLELIKTAKPPLPFIYVDCGTEDRLVESNRRFMQALYAAKIPYEYRELPGAHTWPYWDGQVQQLLGVLRRLGFTRSAEQP
jgi:S-formylglutathione hydrolase FrmB